MNKYQHGLTYAEQVLGLNVTTEQFLSVYGPLRHEEILSASVIKAEHQRVLDAALGVVSE